jgi:hypothetical protein
MPDREFRKDPSPRAQPGTPDTRKKPGTPYGSDGRRGSDAPRASRPPRPPGPPYAADVLRTPASLRRPGTPETDAERRRRRAQFLRDLAEARELRNRVQPRRAKVARLRHAMRMRTFRW